MKTWFDPQPPDAPLRLPRQWPKRVVPSLIGDTGQVLNLLMHHGAGTRVRDYSGYGNHGTMQGASSWVDGPFGWCQRFDGVTGYILVPASPSLDITGIGLTMDLWMRPSITYDATVIVRNDIFVKQYYWIFPGDGTGRMAFMLWVAGGVYSTLYTVQNSWVTGTWYHIICRYDGVNMEIYVNNILDNTKPEVRAILSVPAKVLRIGRGDVGYFNGDIALPRLYSRAITAAERTERFERTRAIFGV